MPSIEDNRLTWTWYGWDQGGDEWSSGWGDTAHLWWGTLFPRLMGFLPTSTILEIAPGYGRITEHLRHFCRRLVLVDLMPRCIEACRQRFASSPHLEFHVTDGRSLPMIRDGSIDLAVSWDSLVHADSDAVHGYVGELARVLAADGVAVLHHSNLAAFVTAPGEPPSVENRHWRAEDVSAASVASACTDAGLHAVVQELVNWDGEDLTDCISVIVRPGSRWDGPPRQDENHRFMDEARNLARIRRIWGGAPPGPAGPGAAAQGTSPDDDALELGDTDSQPFERFAGWTDYRRHLDRHAEREERRRAFERTLAERERAFEWPGFCVVCDAETDLYVGFEYSWLEGGRRMPNYREHLRCPRCGFNARNRAAAHLLRDVVRPERRAKVYLTEQGTPLHAWLAQHLPGVEGSEFLGDDTPLGSRDAQGRRHEDLTRLTFADRSFDLVVSLEVLEHIPDHRSALAEVHRVLRPGGALLLSTPFPARQPRNLLRARVTPEGGIEHLEEPEYHGDPLRPEGCLAFHTFGWELLDELRGIGFSPVEGLVVWSRRFGYLGSPHPFILARRADSHRVSRGGRT